MAASILHTIPYTAELTDVVAVGVNVPVIGTGVGPFASSMRVRL